MANDSTSSEVTLAVLGAPKVGKSALIVRLLTKRFIGEYDSSAGYTAGILQCLALSTYRGEIKHEGESLKFSILDHPGDFQDFSNASISSADCCVVVYSVTDLNSFNQAISHVQMLFEVRDPNENIVLLLGNKRDLAGSRKVSSEQARDVASNLGCVFYEVSAAEDFLNVQSVFKELLIQVRKLRTGEKRQRKLSAKKKAARLFHFGGRARSGTL